MSRNRLTGNDNAFVAIAKMSEGNPGAVQAISEVGLHMPNIDPDSSLAMLGTIGLLFILDTRQIYGSSIYVLWNDKCKRDNRRMVLLLRAVQLGVMEEERLIALAADQAGKLTITEGEWRGLDNRVRAILPNFQEQK